VDVLFEGRLSPELHFKTVLQRVLENKPQGNLLIRISSPNAGSNGRLLVRDGRFVTAALLDDSDESGYAALRQLLAVATGNFAGLRPEQGERIDLVPNLNIELHKVIPLMPALPESPVGLFDEKSLLDQVFSTGSFVKLEQMQPEVVRHDVDQPILKPVQPQVPPMSQMSAPMQQTPPPQMSPPMPQIPMPQMPPSMSSTSRAEKTGPLPQTPPMASPPQPPQMPQIPLPTQPELPAWQNARTVPIPKVNFQGEEPTREIRRPPPLVSYEGLDDIGKKADGRKAPPPTTGQYAKAGGQRSNSPILVIAFVGFLLAGEVVAIIFWKPLNAYLITKNIHLPGVEVHKHGTPKRGATVTPKHH